MHVEYIVNPMYLASLKFSGIFRVLNAYHVHIIINIILYTNDIINENVDTRHVNTAVNGYGYISCMSGLSITNHTIAPANCTDTIPKKDMCVSNDEKYSSVFFFFRRDSMKNNNEVCEVDDDP